MHITIHQPEHMPWLGFFHKINMADIYVVLDNVQYRKNYFQNRNKVRTANGWIWITVPVSRSIETLIKDVTIDTNQRWIKKWRDTIFYNYKKSPFFEQYFDRLKILINEHWEKILDLNVALIRLLCNFLDIKTKFILASELNVCGKGSDLLLAICKKLDAERYLSGISGKEYLRVDDFAREGIKVEFQEFHHPIYNQLYEPFTPCMSIIDLLFNYGEKSLDVINGIGVPVMEEVFL